MEVYFALDLEHVLTWSISGDIYEKTRGIPPSLKSNSASDKKDSP